MKKTILAAASAALLLTTASSAFAMGASADAVAKHYAEIALAKY